MPPTLPTSNELVEAKLVLNHVRAYLAGRAQNMSHADDARSILALGCVQVQIEVLNAAIGIIQTMQQVEEA